MVRQHSCTQSLSDSSHHPRMADHAATIAAAGEAEFAERGGGCSPPCDRCGYESRAPNKPRSRSHLVRSSPTRTQLLACQLGRLLPILEVQPGTHPRHTADMARYYETPALCKTIPLVCRWRSSSIGSRRSPSASPSNATAGAGAVRSATAGQQSGCVNGLTDRLAAAGLKNSRSAAAHPHKPVTTATDMPPIQVIAPTWSYFEMLSPQTAPAACQRPRGWPTEYDHACSLGSARPEVSCCCRTTDPPPEAWSRIPRRHTEGYEAGAGAARVQQRLRI